MSGLNQEFGGRQGSISGYTEEEVDQFQSSSMDRNTIITMKLTSFHNRCDCMYNVCYLCMFSRTVTC